MGAVNQRNWSLKLINNGESSQKLSTSIKNVLVAEIIPKYEEKNYVDTSKLVWNYSLLTDEDVRNYQQGTHYSLYQKFGSHSIEVNGKWGMYFCVWAPNGTSVSLIGNFNHWKK